MKTINIKNRAREKWQKLLLVFTVALTLQGCFLFGSEDSEPPDVCENVFNAFVSQDRDGIGVTSERCAGSARGEWINGRCYCKGASDG